MDKKASAQKVYETCLGVEIDPKYDLETRRVIRDERFALHAAFESKDPQRIASAATEAQRVLKMWTTEAI